MERFAHAVVELVVDNGAPVFRFLIRHRLNIYKRETRTANRGVRPGSPKLKLCWKTGSGSWKSNGCHNAYSL